jgi:hypothetical protein
MKSTLIIIVSLLVLSGSLQAKANYYEERIIEKQVQSSFRVLMETWKEELYFDLYDLGQFYSRKDMTLEEFAQRMVDLKWKPSLLAEKILKFELRYRTFATIYAVIQFEHKVDPTRVIKKLVVFPAILENKVWKFNLFQLIRTPYIGKYYPLDSEKKDVKETKGDKSKEGTKKQKKVKEPEKPKDQKGATGSNKAKVIPN